MKATLDEDGHVLLQVETAADWHMLESITKDGKRYALADALADSMEDDAVRQDWSDYVVPDLNDTFSQQLQFLSNVISHARTEAQAGIGTIVIPREDADTWYGALNQARLALEDRFDLSTMDSDEVMALPQAHRSAYFRSHIYLQMQSMLLDCLMAP